MPKSKKTARPSFSLPLIENNLIQAIVHDNIDRFQQELNKLSSAQFLELIQQDASLKFLQQAVHNSAIYNACYEKIGPEMYINTILSNLDYVDYLANHHKQELQHRIINGQPAFSYIRCNDVAVFAKFLVNTINALGPKEFPEHFVQAYAHVSNDFFNAVLAENDNQLLKTLLARGMSELVKLRQFGVYSTEQFKNMLVRFQNPILETVIRAPNFDSFMHFYDEIGFSELSAANSGLPIKNFYGLLQALKAPSQFIIMDYYVCHMDPADWASLEPLIKVIIAKNTNIRDQPKLQLWLASTAHKVGFTARPLSTQSGEILDSLARDLASRKKLSDEAKAPESSNPGNAALSIRVSAQEESKIRSRLIADVLNKVFYRFFVADIALNHQSQYEVVVTLNDNLNLMLKYKIALIFSGFSYDGTRYILQHPEIFIKHGRRVAITLVQIFFGIDRAYNLRSAKDVKSEFCGSLFLTLHTLNASMPFLANERFLSFINNISYKEFFEFFHPENLLIMNNFAPMPALIGRFKRIVQKLEPQEFLQMLSVDHSEIIVFSTDSELTESFFSCLGEEHLKTHVFSEDFLAYLFVATAYHGNCQMLSETWRRMVAFSPARTIDQVLERVVDILIKKQKKLTTQTCCFLYENIGRERFVRLFFEAEENLEKIVNSEDVNDILLLVKEMHDESEEALQQLSDSIVERLNLLLTPAFTNGNDFVLKWVDDIVDLQKIMTSNVGVNYLTYFWFSLNHINNSKVIDYYLETFRARNDAEKFIKEILPYMLVICFNKKKPQKRQKLVEWLRASFTPAQLVEALRSLELHSLLFRFTNSTLIDPSTNILFEDYDINLGRANKIQKIDIFNWLGFKNISLENDSDKIWLAKELLNTGDIKYLSQAFQVAASIDAEELKDAVESECCDNLQDSLLNEIFKVDSLRGWSCSVTSREDEGVFSFVVTINLPENIRINQSRCVALKYYAVSASNNKIVITNLADFSQQLSARGVNGFCDIILNENNHPDTVDEIIEYIQAALLAKAALALSLHQSKKNAGLMIRGGHLFAIELKNELEKVNIRPIVTKDGEAIIVSNILTRNRELIISAIINSHTIAKEKEKAENENMNKARVFVGEVIVPAKIEHNISNNKPSTSTTTNVREEHENQRNGRVNGNKNASKREEDKGKKKYSAEPNLKSGRFFPKTAAKLRPAKREMNISDTKDEEIAHDLMLLKLQVEQREALNALKASFINAEPYSNNAETFGTLDANVKEKIKKFNLPDLAVGTLESKEKNASLMQQTPTRSEELSPPKLLPAKTSANGSRFFNHAAACTTETYSELLFAQLRMQRAVTAVGGRTNLSNAFSNASNSFLSCFHTLHYIRTHYPLTNDAKTLPTVVLLAIQFLLGRLAHSIHWMNRPNGYNHQSDETLGMFMTNSQQLRDNCFHKNWLNIDDHQTILTMIDAILAQAPQVAAYMANYEITDLGTAVLDGKQLIEASLPADIASLVHTKESLAELSDAFLLLYYDKTIDKTIKLPALKMLTVSIADGMREIAGNYGDPNQEWQDLFNTLTEGNLIPKAIPGSQDQYYTMIEYVAYYFRHCYGYDAEGNPVFYASTDIANKGNLLDIETNMESELLKVLPYIEKLHQLSPPLFWSAPLLR